ncbi:hypothetical protein DPMN_175371 [Dreissena polymorpha]|uniref:Uncharacterized protein n=1 Tax=Dreissena polymorpha TaxID=45954 RepID=A0A9D4E8X8_DREPO|nr:hypothetical protein DPMN_175371 [Dreissena polymorpha]
MDTVQLKQDVFEFTRKLRLKEYFGSCEDITVEDEQTSEDQDSKYQTKGNSTFIPPAGQDTVLDFNIKAIAHEFFYFQAQVEH